MNEQTNILQNSDIDRYTVCYDAGGNKTTIEVFTDDFHSAAKIDISGGNPHYSDIEAILENTIDSTCQLLWQNHISPEAISMVTGILMIRHYIQVEPAFHSVFPNASLHFLGEKEINHFASLGKSPGQDPMYPIWIIVTAIITAVWDPIWEMREAVMTSDFRVLRLRLRLSESEGRKHCWKKNCFYNGHPMFSKPWMKPANSSIFRQPTP